MDCMKFLFLNQLKSISVYSLYPKLCLLQKHFSRIKENIKKKKNRTLVEDVHKILVCNFMVTYSTYKNFLIIL